MKNDLFRILETIAGNGSFVTFGVRKFNAIGLEIKGLGELGFPLNPIQKAHP